MRCHLSKMGREDTRGRRIDQLVLVRPAPQNLLDLNSLSSPRSEVGRMSHETTLYD